MTILEIDGSFGEGGGQIVRIASSFSIIFGKPIHVTKVRAGRNVPGLRPQHAATLKLLRDVCGGSLEGGSIGSTEFTFSPGRPTSRSLSIDMGTAASMTLVLQALVPAVSLSKVSLDLELTGGTDVPWSPTSDYFGAVVVPGFRRIGIEFGVEILRRGYYPRGGGKARIHIAPCSEVKSLNLPARGAGTPISIVSRAGALPRRVAERQVESAISTLRRSGLVADHISVLAEDSVSPGTSILISAVSDTSFMGSDAIGVKGKPAERVGMDAAGHFVRTYESGACLDPNLTDMVAPLLCLAREPSSILTSSMTGHLKTSVHVAKQFVNADCRAEERGAALLLTILPR